MLKAIVFDLDGVLIDSEPLMRFAFAESYRQVIGEGPPPIEAYLEHMGESFPCIMDQIGLPRTLWQPFREISQTHLEQITLFPETVDLLTRVRALPLKLAILTGKDRTRTLQLLDYFGLSHFFEAVVTSDQLQSPKPDPEGMLVALRQLGCTAPEAVMVGDSVSDILCAQRAGVQAIAVTWGIKPERVQTLCRPDYIVGTWDLLFEVLWELHQGRSEKAQTLVAQVTEQNTCGD